LQIFTIRMNTLENWFCATSFWRRVTQHHILPWLLNGHSLGDNVLELGAGPGATTEELRHRCVRLTSLEYDQKFAAQLKARYEKTNVGVLRGDAATLPFADAAFSSVIAILVLHHLRSSEQQEKAFAEIRRVLSPGGAFLVFEISDSWIHRVGHFKSTFVPLAPETASKQLESLGFSNILVEKHRGAFRICALRGAV
jgi:ubiquinone/menaquinone biosynthesis C-methylase UbiE